ncbi:MAG: RNA polymerase sigma-70 factor (ECF subfamily) [Planctomycetota bacterium]|jgi:RNA polymerase sigma-70 factor (ECF subfamily)
MDTGNTSGKSRGAERCRWDSPRFCPASPGGPAPGGPVPDLAVQLLQESDWVRSLAQSLVRSEADAEDLAQDAIVEALEARGSRRPRRLRAWLATTTRRKALDYYRRRSTRAEALHRLGTEAVAAEGAPPLDSDERFALHEELARALRGLPQADRDLLLRRHVDQVPPRQLASELGMTSEQVRKRLTRALDQVRQKLRQTERGEAGWNRALLALAAPAVSAMGPSFLASLTAMSITKTLVATAALALMGATAWWWLSPDTISPPDSPSPPRASRRNRARVQVPPHRLSESSTKPVLQPRAPRAPGSTLRPRSMHSKWTDLASLS